jgi:hypothetical protein
MATDPLERLLGGPDPVVVPRPEFAEALLSQLLTVLATGADVQQIAPRPQVTVLAYAGPESVPMERGHRRAFAWLAAAALLLIAVGAGYIAFWPDRNEQRTTIPAVVVPATPTDETLIEVTLPAESLPAGPAGSGFDVNTLSASSQTTWTTPSLVQARYVLSGRVAIRSNAPIRILRASNVGVWETEPADSDVLLGPGDAAYFAPMATADFTSVGPAAAELLTWIIGASPLPAGWTDNAYAVPAGREVSLPGGPAVLRIKRLIAQPDSELPLEPGAILFSAITMRRNPEGTPIAATLIDQNNSGPVLAASEPAVVYVVSLTPVTSNVSPAGSAAASPAAS